MHNLHHKLYVIEGFNGMLYVFSSHCYCHPVIYSLSLFIIYSVNSFIANVICYITIPSLNKVLYLVSCNLKAVRRFLLMFMVKYISGLCTCLISLYILHRELSRITLKPFCIYIYIYIFASLLKLLNELSFVLHELLFPYTTKTATAQEIFHVSNPFMLYWILKHFTIH